MSHLVQLVIELVLITFLLVYRDDAINSFNEWFLLNIELIQPSLKMIFKLDYV